MLCGVAGPFHVNTLRAGAQDVVFAKHILPHYGVGWRESDVRLILAHSTACNTRVSKCLTAVVLKTGHTAPQGATSTLLGVTGEWRKISGPQ
jgi:hypothetical protein